MTIYILACIILSIVFFLLCTYTYKTNKFALSLIIIFLYLFSFTSWGYLFAILLFIFIISTMILQIRDLIIIPKEQRTLMFLINILLFIIAIILIILALSTIEPISIGRVHYLIDKFNFISIPISLYLIFYQIFSITEENKEVKEWKKDSLKCKRDIKLYLESLKEKLPVFLKDENIFINNKINERMNLYITKEDLEEYLRLKNIYIDFKKQMPKSIHKDMKMFGVSFVMIAFCTISIITNYKNYTVLDVPSLIKLEYNVNNYVTDVSLLPLWEYEDREAVEEKLSDLGYIKDDMIHTLKGYKNFDSFDLKSVNTDITLSPSTNLQQKSEVDVKFNYNYNIAKKSKFKIKNPYFTTTPEYLRASITQEEFEKNYLSEWELEKALDAKLDEEKIKYNKATITSEKIQTDFKDDYDVSYLTLDVSLDGIKGDKEINNATYKVEIFYQNDELRLDPSNSTLEY